MVFVKRGTIYHVGHLGRAVETAAELSATGGHVEIQVPKELSSWTSREKIKYLRNCQTKLGSISLAMDQQALLPASRSGSENFRPKWNGMMCAILLWPRISWI